MIEKCNRRAPPAVIALASLLALPASYARAQECPPVPAPAVDLTIERYYEDGAGSIVEPTRMEAHKAQTAPLVEFVGFITQQADRAWQQRSSPQDTIACTLAWLKGWADGGAYLGKMSSKQAEAQRRWDLAGTALAYVKVRQWASAEERAAIEPWLIKWADAARAAFDDKGVKRNNHWYWLGLAVGATAIATGSERHWVMARDIMKDAARDITADGIFPLELARGGRALHYHVFSVMPVVMLAELGASRGEDWYAFNDGAVHRLVDVTLRGLADPRVFERLSGVPQQPRAGSGSGWLHLYRLRFAERLPPSLPDSPRGHRWIGGDALSLKAALDRLAPRRP